MALTTTALGLTTVSNTLTSYYDIFAVPPDPNDVIVATLTSTTASYNPGQVFYLSTWISSVPQYSVVATKAALIALTNETVGVLTQATSQTANTGQGILCIKGNFIQNKLTPADIPVGAYFHGNLIIEKENS